MKKRQTSWLGKRLKAVLASAAIGAASAIIATPAAAFCGFYVSGANTALFNDASKVVLVREGDKTSITMANDYTGAPTDFAMVVPVPQVPERDEIRLSENRLIEHLDNYTAPRLVEYFDPNPCEVRKMRRMEMTTMAAPMMADNAMAAPPSAQALGVTIEAEYAVGEYDIQILSARQSNGLLTFLNQSGYRVPQQAVPILRDYIANGMKFFVARVNLGRHSSGVANGKGQFLTPLQIRMISKKFMLPIRLGTVNARGDQELFVFAITREGRVEGANYPTVKMPADVNVPPFTEKVFGRFYQDMFARERQMTPVPAMFLEYAWDLSWCDPCAANPPAVDDLIALGVDWLRPQSKMGTRSGSSSGGIVMPPPPPTPLPGNGNNLQIMPLPLPVPQPFPQPGIIMPPQAIDAFITRLHLRYNKVSHPRDLEFKVTNDRENFQGRFIMQQPYLGNAVCDAVTAYRQDVKRREQQEAINLARLTGWSIDYIQRQQQVYPGKPMNERDRNQR